MDSFRCVPSPSRFQRIQQMQRQRSRQLDRSFRRRFPLRAKIQNTTNQNIIFEVAIVKQRDQLLDAMLHEKQPLICAV